MKGPDRDRAALGDMLRYAQRVRSHTATGRESIDDQLAQDAVLYELAIIGEAAGRVSKSLCENHPEIPWRPIIAQRNIVVHVYDKLNLNRLWQAVEALPQLEENLQALLSELDQPDGRDHLDP